MGSVPDIAVFGAIALVFFNGVSPSQFEDAVANCGTDLIATPAQEQGTVLNTIFMN